MQAASERATKRIEDRFVDLDIGVLDSLGSPFWVLVLRGEEADSIGILLGPGQSGVDACSKIENGVLDSFWNSLDER